MAKIFKQTRPYHSFPRLSLFNRRYTRLRNCNNGFQGRHTYLPIFRSRIPKFMDARLDIFHEFLERKDNTIWRVKWEREGKFNQRHIISTDLQTVLKCYSGLDYITVILLEDLRRTDGDRWKVSGIVSAHLSHSSRKVWSNSIIVGGQLVIWIGIDFSFDDLSVKIIMFCQVEGRKPLPISARKVNRNNHYEIENFEFYEGIIKIQTSNKNESTFKVKLTSCQMY